jgi:hypothetical protein
MRLMPHVQSALSSTHMSLTIRGRGTPEPACFRGHDAAPAISPERKRPARQPVTPEIAGSIPSPAEGVVSFDH